MGMSNRSCNLGMLNLNAMLSMHVKLKRQLRHVKAYGILYNLTVSPGMPH
jgi:hypothetical protein